MGDAMPGRSVGVKPDPGPGSWPGILSCSTTFPMQELGAEMNRPQFSEFFTLDLRQFAMDEV